MNFGKNFIKARNQRGMDQKYAAAELGLSAGYLSRVENDKQKPSLELILNAAELYNVEPGFFFDVQENVDIEKLYNNKNIKFIKDLENKNFDEINEKYKIHLDGEELTEEEIKGIMTYIRTRRQIE